MRRPLEAADALLDPSNMTAAERDASVARMLAEAEAFTAAAEESRAAAREHHALAAGAELQAVQTKHAIEQSRVEATIAGITLDKILREEKLARVSDLYHHVYTFDDVVTDRSVRMCTNTLTAWSRSDPGCEMRVIINSGGGDIVAGFNLVDFITDLRARGHQITTVALGMAASMAAVILQAGDVRVMGKNAMLLLHEGSLDVSGNFGSAEDMMRLMKIFHEQILDLFESRAKSINPKTTKAFLRKAWQRTDFWVGSTRALELGLVDEVQ